MAVSNVKPVKDGCMISQPMRGLTEEQIQEARERAISDIHSQGYNFVNTYLSDDWAKAHKIGSTGINNPVMFLSGSIQRMATCRAVYFCNGWSKARGCVIEYIIANQYGLMTWFAPGADKELEEIYDAEGKIRIPEEF